MYHFDPNAFSSPGSASAGQGPDAPPPPNMGITDEELLDSLVMHDAPSSNGAHLAYRQGQHHPHPGAVALGGPPFRSLPPHLGGASPMAFHSPVSPADMYSPASGSTSNPDSFFWDREGSLSTGDEILAGQGRGSSGEVSDQGERAGGAAKPTTGLRQVTTRRGYMASAHSPYAFIGGQERPQAFSVPTYLASPSAPDPRDRAWDRSASKDMSALRLSEGSHGQNRPRASQTFGALGNDLAITGAKATIAPSSAPAFGSSRMTDPASAAKDADEQAKPPQLSEKKRRRRESHNAVERRRRDNINERIAELATLLPEFMLEGLRSNGVFSEDACDDDALDASQSAGMRALSPQAAAAAAKPNKGIILTKSVQYIRHLQSLVEAQNQRNNELEGLLRAAGERHNFADLASSTSTLGQPPHVSDYLFTPDPFRPKAEPCTPSTSDLMRD